MQLTEQPETGVRMGRLFSKYHTLSPLQAQLSVFYAKVKINGKWEYRGIRNTWFKKDLTLLQVYELITGPAFKTETDTLQSIADEKVAKEFKSSHFNYGCISCTVSTRSEKGVVKHSGLICIDLDNLGAQLPWIRETVNQDPKTIMSFVSPSGNGLKVIYQIDPSKHSQKLYYQYLSDYLTELCCLPKKKVDESCSDVSRACFLPHDPNAYLNIDLI